MILKYIHKILIWGIIAVFLIGTSPNSFAFKSKKHSKSRQSTTHVSKKSASKKKSSTAKKSSVRKSSAKKRSTLKKRSRTVSRSKRKSGTSIISRKKTSTRIPVKEVVRKDTNYVNPDDLPALEDDQEDLPVETQTIKVSDLLQKYVVSNQSDNSTDSVNHREKIIMEIIKYLDTPYKFGGNTSKGIDCSAFTRTVLGNTLSLDLPRTAREQFQLGQEISDKSELKFGDLIFFNTRRRVRPGHVGIYIGDNLFAHSSSRQGVMVSSLETEFYSKRFMGGRRYEAAALRH